MELQRLADTLEIHELLARYARGVDTKDWELWKSVFTADAVVDYSSAGIPVGSRDEIAALFAAAFGAIEVAQHIITNIEIEWDGDRARVRALFHNPFKITGAAEMSFCGGYYLHDVLRTADGWKSAHLVETNQWFVNQPGTPGFR